MRVKFNFVIFLFSWLFILKYPHFTSIYVNLIVTSLLGLLILYTLNVTLKSELKDNLLIKSGIIFLVLGGFIIGLIGLIINQPKFYEKWAGLGGGTMHKDGVLQIFADLAHLTSAAKCSLPIKVGENICDEFGRPFNQNPQIATLFRVFKITHVVPLGIFTTFFLFFLVYILIKKFKIVGIGVYLFFATPVLLLAIDRGNEVVTILFILIGIFALNSNFLRFQTIGSIFLVLASLYKLWPTILIAFILILNFKRIKCLPKTLFFTSFIYWGLRTELLFLMLKSTDVGSPFGYSFGLKLVWSNQLPYHYTILVLIMIVLLFFTFIKFGKSSFETFVISESDMKILNFITPFLLTYFCIWIIGDSYIYRLLILLPIILELSKPSIFEFEFPKYILSILLCLCIVSLTPFGIVITSSLALYFVYIMLRIMHLKRIKIKD